MCKVLTGRAQMYEDPPGRAQDRALVVSDQSGAHRAPEGLSLDDRGVRARDRVEDRYDVVVSLRPLCADNHVLSLSLSLSLTRPWFPPASCLSISKPTTYKVSVCAGHVKRLPDLFSS